MWFFFFVPCRQIAGFDGSNHGSVLWLRESHLTQRELPPRRCQQRLNPYLDLCNAFSHGDFDNALGVIPELGRRNTQVAEQETHCPQVRQVDVTREGRIPKVHHPISGLEEGLKVAGDRANLGEDLSNPP
jgi:hypothetical protein